jgi:carboxypeptidase T
VGSAFVDVVDAKTTARVSGIVRDARNSAPLRQTALIRSERLGTASSSTTSNYALRLMPGSRMLIASSAGYLDASASLNLSAGSNTTQSFALTPICPALQDLFDGDVSAWTAQAPWATTTTRSVSAPRSFTDSPNGNYANNTNTALTSPVVSTQGFSQLELQFSSFCAVQPSGDFGRVDLSIDGGSSFTELWRCNARPFWEDVRIALPTASNQAAVRLRFRLTSDASNTNEGWYIDNVRLLGGSLACPFTSDLIFGDGFGN